MRSHVKRSKLKKRRKSSLFPVKKRDPTSSHLKKPKRRKRSSAVITIRFPVILASTTIFRLSQRML